MIEDVKIVGSDGWWLSRLFDELNARPDPHTVHVQSRRGVRGRRDWMDILWSYRVGEPPHANWSSAKKEAMRDFLRQANANYAGLTVEALLDRINLVGARAVPHSDGEQSPDADGDETVRTILTRSGPWLSDALDFAFALSEGYVMVGARDGKAIVTAEDPRQVVAITDPLDPLRIVAALKCFRDDVEGVDKAYLYLPADDTNRQDRLRVATRKAGGKWGRLYASSWVWDGEAKALPVQGFGTPFVKFENRLGLGEFEPHLDLLDRITNMIMDRLWISKIQAYRQRALERDKDVPAIPAVDPETGEEIDLDSLFASGPDALWELPAGYRIWESAPVDMQSILMSVREDIKEFSAVTRTPLSMFTPDAAAGSAEGASLMREGLVFKSRDRIRRFTPGAAKVVSMALAYEAGAPAIAEVQPMWDAVEVHTLTEKGAAAAAAFTAGVPWEIIMTEVMQFGPETMARAAQARVGDVLMKSMQEAQTVTLSSQQATEAK